MVDTLHDLGDLLIGLCAVPRVLVCLLCVRMRDRVEIALWHLRCVAHVHIEVCLNWNHVHRLNSFKLLVIHVMHSRHVVLLLFSSMSLE